MVFRAFGNTVVHDFEEDMRLTEFMGLTEKSCYDKALNLVNNRHDFKGNFPYDDFFRKTHARLYMGSRAKALKICNYQSAN